MGIAPAPGLEERRQAQKQSCQEGPMAMAFRVCEIKKDTPEYNRNAETFRNCMRQIGDVSRVMEILIQFESEKKQGEMKSVQNLAALLTIRLMEEVSARKQKRA